MPKRNSNIAKLQSGYLFPEINRRKKAFLDRNPKAKLLSLGIGDTTEPITPHIDKALVNAAASLGTREGYSGYGDEQGMAALREKIASVLYKGMIKGEEVFVSDGAKPDIGRLQLLFGNDAVVAVQDPAYPVYIDSTVMYGKTGKYNESRKRFENIVYMPCNPENNFFPDLKKIPKADVIFFCSPNNPTGAVAARQQLKELVEYARKNKSIIVFDSAYSEYISDKNLPKSIYEIKGAKEVAIEVSSFSKPIGFTGVRLGWAIVPNELKFSDGSFVRNDWNRITATLFNGASNIAQRGGLAALDKQGLKEMRQTISYYMENAKIVRKALKDAKCEAYGGENAPYLWARIKGMGSWEAFEYLLEEAHIVTTPGVGFGQQGEGFLRFSAFGHRENIHEAANRLKECLKKMEV